MAVAMVKSSCQLRAGSASSQRWLSPLRSGGWHHTLHSSTHLLPHVYEVGALLLLALLLLAGIAQVTELALASADATLGVQKSTWLACPPLVVSRSHARQL